MVTLKEYTLFLDRSKLQSLIDALMQSGYQCVGPQVKENSIVYDNISTVAQLPLGYSAEQQPGSYRLVRNSGNRYFAWANGAQNIKPLVFKPRQLIWSVTQDQKGSYVFVEGDAAAPKMAIIGARACDIAALELLDKHFLDGDYRDPFYSAARDNMILIAVNCSHAAETCFCASTGDGPRASFGYDIALSELDSGFLLHAPSDKGEAIVKQLSLQASTETQRHQAAEEIQQAAKQQQRKVPLRNLYQILISKLEHPRWEDVAARCLSCGNCTMVCPSCFCHAQVEQQALDGGHSDHYRQWDSCFTQGHSYIHGITIRSDTRSRYRQWLMHKFAVWHQQYGRSGCVGCGRCITWCPVGIDVTEELAALTAEVVDA